MITSIDVCGVSNYHCGKLALLFFTVKTTSVDICKIVLLLIWPILRRTRAYSCKLNTWIKTSITKQKLAQNTLWKYKSHTQKWVLIKLNLHCINWTFVQCFIITSYQKHLYWRIWLSNKYNLQLASKALYWFSTHIY